MTNFLDACNIELSNHSLNNVYAVYVKCKKGCTLKFVTTQIVCGGCLGTPNTLQRSNAFIQSVLTLKNLSLVFLKYKKFCVWKKLRKRIKKWRSTNLKNGALCKTLKESPYSASPSRAELNSKQNTPNTCDKTMAKRYMTNITETKEQWNKSIFSRSGIFLCKKVLGLNAKNRQFWSSSASTVRSVRKVFLHISFLSGYERSFSPQWITPHKWVTFGVHSLTMTGLWFIYYGINCILIVTHIPGRIRQPTIFHPLLLSYPCSD